MNSNTGTRSARSQNIAVALSTIWPGAGQWYLGHRRAALVYALPLIGLAIAIGYQVATGFESFAISLLDPSVALTMVALIVLALVWRLLSMVDTVIPPNPVRGRRIRTMALAGVLGASMLVIHGGAAYYAWSFYQAGSRIFVGSVNPDQSMEPSPTEDWDYGFGQQPFETPSAPVTGKPRLTILLTGIDKNTDRTHSLTDTLLVVSIDPNTHTVAMVSTPRDVSEFLLPDGRQYNGKINSLMSWANARPELYPEGGLAVLARTISNLLGVPINYYAAIDLDGFERIINEAGGVDVTVSRAITDGRYDWLDGSERGFYLSKGDHHLDGRTALAYVRSRQGTGDSDFTRAARQQQLLLALRAKLTDPGMFTKLPSLLDAAADMIRTNFPNDQLSTMLDLARVIGDDSFTRIVLQPPTYSYHPPTNTTNGTYILRLKMDAVAQLSVDLFGTDSRYFGTVAATPTGSPAP